MKNLKYILIVLVLGVGVFLWFQSRQVKNTKISDVIKEVDKVADTKTEGKRELCFAKFGTPDVNGSYDKYTLRLLLDGEKATGELNLIPKDKDRKIGEFKGTITTVDPKMIARTANLQWFTFAEGMNVEEELKIILGVGKASVGFGEMVLKADGTYVYKDPKKIAYNLSLMDVACSDLIERVNVETYLQDNITELSPVKAVLGGKWYIVYATIDLAKNSGVVVYEDGHVQEKKNFTYTTNEKSEIVILTIK